MASLKIGQQNIAVCIYSILSGGNVNVVWGVMSVRAGCSCRFGVSKSYCKKHKWKECHTSRERGQNKTSRPY